MSGPPASLRPMPPAVPIMKKRFVAADPQDVRQVALLAAIHFAALGLLIWSEHEWEAQAGFILAWGFLNFFWLAALRRPVTSAALSLAMIVLLIVLSQFTHGVMMMTVTFVDVMLVDIATVSFLMPVIAAPTRELGLGTVAAVLIVA